MNITQDILSDLTVWLKYAKYDPQVQRRETWNELVTRNKDMHLTKFPQLRDEIEDVYQLVYNKKVLPSMRSLQFAGKPIDINNSRIFNCSFLHIDSYHAFSEIMFLLLSGCGVGYSIQQHHIERLPEIRKPLKSKRYLVGDSIEGWSDAVRMLVKSYFGLASSKPDFDFRDIRQKGAQLITVGGKAPGPDPLRIALIHVQNIFERKQDGDKLTSDECHDIICHLADAVLSGGIRRAALIALFNLDDEAMLNSKNSSIISTILSKEHPTYTDGEGLKHDLNKLVLKVEQNGIIYDNVILYIDKTSEIFWDIDQYERDGTLGWWVCNPQRGRANNSAVLLRNKIDINTFLDLWKKIEESNSGEPGFLFTNDKDLGTNPCAEISLKTNQFCNLTTINASNIESQEDYNNRAKAAAFIGTLQASYTNFHYLRDNWKKTTEKEALLGVSMTGIASGEVFKYDMKEAAKVVVEENARVAEIIGINKAARSTTVKPEGTASLVVGTSSGIHDWHDKFYLRSIRVGKNEAIYPYFQIYHPNLVEDDYFKPAIQAVVSVPQKAPEGAITREINTALGLLERIKKVNKEWIKPGHRKGNNTHNVSATVTIKPDEWDKVGQWVFSNRESFTALSFLPYKDHSYVQAPFQTITEQEYNEKSQNLHSLDLTKVIEIADNTSLSESLACAGGNCEVA